MTFLPERKTHSALNSLYKSPRNTEWTTKKSNSSIFFRQTVLVCMASMTVLNPTQFSFEIGSPKVGTYTYTCTLTKLKSNYATSKALFVCLSFIR